MNRQNIRQEIISKIIMVPDENLDSIKDYIDFVIEKERNSSKKSVNKKKPKTSDKKAKNLMEKLIGKAEVEPFAHKIDDILYRKS